MSLIPYNPWDIDHFFDDEEFDDFLTKVNKSSIVKAPRMDIYEEGNNVIAEIEMPGVDPKDIDVEVQDNTLKVESKTETKKEEKKKGYYRKELSKGYFRRVAPLPVEVSRKESDAVYKDGILKVTIPKAKKKQREEKSTKVKVKNK
jgi:HSP20 family protein